MQAEHDGLARVLEKNGVGVEYVEGSPKNPKAMFVRDTAIAVKGGVIICRMGVVGEEVGTGRRGEESYVSRRLASMGMPILRTIHGTGLLEGGSFCILDEHHAVVGTSYRQNASGVDQLRNVLSHLDMELIEVPLTGYSLHIDRAIVMVDHGKALVDVSRLPFWFLDRLKELNIKTVDVDPEDVDYANNCLAIAPGKIVMCQGSDRTADKLNKLGIDVIQVPYDECHKNGGGIHCSTLPLIREKD
jgi:N-dimethylarginine dimethylaminohydrolase